MTHLLHSQRIPDELAKGIGTGEARVVGPSGGKVKVWRVEAGRDGDGAFLGRGWPEIAAAFSVGDRWFLVLQHHGGGILTLKAFDASEATTSSKDVSHRPQFVSVLPHDFMEKMLIPAKFVEHYIPEEHKNSRMAMVLVSHDVTQANALLLKYEGNMVFTVRVFGPDGFQRESKDKDIRIQQVEQKINPSMVVFESVSSGYECEYLPYAFCDAIGLREPCTITLKTSMSSTRSWQVLVVPNKNSSHYVRGLDWKRFCEENEIKVGDVCTISIVETTLWHVARQ
ncbi:putative B3 domain-containing protein Os04g0347400 [Setaria italica]|uniref:putative B3 domain-containing protein Os04g0347400 n=1 Tax=Setaria italica TaxID=4555 RepID=UPI0003513E57|nr:putative B3 domain-containing protein Os04g0347400 [Setaria italica]